ncbi:unnamed protein product [Schistosoma curassoni]|uniref:PIH1 domain-containing protein n=1 Tax=Schistosoma curassoni TaxID=6186 RepID=A0A183KER8_9TREM|nr:unnamed protein product [Schistosoma curassoni]
MKRDIEATTDMFHVLIKKILEEKQLPMDWKEGYLINIPKKEDLSKCENHKSITLPSLPGKLFDNVAEPGEGFSRCSTSKTTNWILEASVAHRPNRDTTDYCLTIH